MTVKKLFEKKFKKVLHKDGIWISVSSKQLTEKTIRSLIEHNRLHNILLLIPGSNKLFYRLPPIVQNTVISFVTYVQPPELEQWFVSVGSVKKSKDPVIIASMQKPFYIKWAKRFNTQIRKSHHPPRRILYKPPELATKADLARLFATGFSLCIYTGHGRSRGWSGYRGFRWEDIDAEKTYKPAGVVLSLSCSAFKDERNRIPFAMKWVKSGRLNTFCGFSTLVHIQPLIVISNHILDFIATHQKATLSSFVLYLNQRIGELENEKVVEEWKSFRIAGNPLMRIL